MGMTKALMEKVMVAKARNLDSSKTIFVELDMEMLWDQGAHYSSICKSNKIR